MSDTPIQSADNPTENVPREEVLFETSDLLVRAITFGTNATAFLTFDSYTDHQTLDRTGFGEPYFRARQISALHVISRTNSWYQLEEIDAAIACIRRWTAQFPRVVAYGSSMGGYAALTLGADCGAHVGLALSPQFSVDPTVVPFERRWLADTATISFLRDRQHASLSAQYIAFDPLDRADAQHAALYTSRCPTIFIRAPHGGHPVGAFLNEAHILGSILDELSIDEISDERAKFYERQLRQSRRGSGQYLSALASKIPAWRPRQALAVAELAIRANPLDPGYLSLYAALLDDTGRFEEARKYHLEAIAKPSSGPYHSCRYARHLLLSGHSFEAEELTKSVIASHPDLAFPVVTLRNIQVAIWYAKFPRWMSGNQRFKDITTTWLNYWWSLLSPYRGRLRIYNAAKKNSLNF